MPLMIPPAFHGRDDRRLVCATDSEDGIIINYGNDVLVPYQGNISLA